MCVLYVACVLSNWHRGSGLRKRGLLRGDPLTASCHVTLGSSVLPRPFLVCKMGRVASANQTKMFQTIMNVHVVNMWWGSSGPDGTGLLGLWELGYVMGHIGVVGICVDACACYRLDVSPRFRC